MCQGVALDGMFGRMKSKTVSQVLDKLASVGEAISTYLMRFEQAGQGQGGLEWKLAVVWTVLAGGLSW